MTGPVLVILPNNPGDVIMALQMIGRLKFEFPRFSFDYLVSDECQTLVVNNPLLERIHIIPRQVFKHQWNSGDVFKAQAIMEGFLSELSSIHYELSLNLFQEKLGGVLQAMVDAEHKLGLELVGGQTFQIKSRYLEHLAAIPALRSENGWHAIDLYIRAARRFLVILNGTAPEKSVPVSRPWLANKSSLLPPLIRPEVARNLIPKSFLVFHPGSAWKGKRWPESHWTELTTLCFKAGYTIVFTGAPEENPIMERILSGLNAEVSASLVIGVGKTSLLEAGWLLANAQLVVTGDTVAMHLAAATGTPTLSLFGPSNPIETGPYGQGHTLFQTDLHPLPDLAFESDHQGLKQLLPQAVAAYIVKGILPEKVSVWQTEWNEEMEMQILTDPKRAGHPNLKTSMTLMKVLDQGAEATQTDERPWSGTRAELWTALKEALETTTPAAIARLESNEHRLAAETQASLIWEAYRIAINGLPILDLAQHLSLRMARLALALKEERQMRNMADNGT